MITQELRDKGISCKGRGFNCSTCKGKNECIDYEDVNKKEYTIQEVFEFREGIAFHDEKGVKYKVINRELKFKMPILTHKWIDASVDKDTVNMKFTLVNKYY